MSTLLLLWLACLACPGCASGGEAVPGVVVPADEDLPASNVSPPLPGTRATVGALPGGRPGDRMVELGDAVWERNGRTQQTGVGAGLVYEQRGVHWSTVFSIDAPGTYALRLDWEPGPDGVLMELLLDGRRLGLPRDAWRPTQRRVVAELGSAWLGPGGHLLEFVSREDGAGAVARPRAVQLLRLPRDEGGAPASLVDAR